MAGNLTTKEQRDIIIEAGMQLLPGGSVLSSLYFGKKQEQRFKRLEFFYQELALEIKNSKRLMTPNENTDPFVIEALLESLHEKVETEVTYEKKQHYKHFFTQVIIGDCKVNYDKSKHFLESLASMSLLELEVLSFLKKPKNKSVQVGQITKPNTDTYAIRGSLHTLISRGFVMSRQHGLRTSGDNFEHCSLSVTETGTEFHEYCLSPEGNQE